jgi:WD40 repeat protein
VADVLYTPDGTAIVSASSDGFVRFWDAPTGKLRWRVAFAGRDEFPVVLTLSSDARTLGALSRFEYVSIGTETGKVLIRQSWAKTTDENVPSCLAMSPDLATLARGCCDGSVRLYDAVTAREKLRIAVGDKAKFQSPNAIHFSADGKRVFVAAYSIRAVTAYDVESGRPVRSLKTDGFSAQRLVASSDRRLLAGLAEGFQRVIIWDMPSGKARHVMDRVAICGAFSPDGALLALGSQWQEIVLLDTATGKERRRLHWHPSTLSLVFSPDGKTLASGDGSGCLAVWDVATGKLRACSPEPSSAAYNLSFVAGGKQLLTHDDGLSWWDVATGRLVRHVPHDPEWWPGYMTVSSDGALLAVLSLEGEIVLVDTRTGQRLRTLPKSGASTFSPDGAKLFCAGGFDGRITIREVSTGKSLQRLESHARFVNRVAVSPNGRWLASWGDDRFAAEGDYDIRLWDTAGGKLAHRLAPRGGPAQAIVFSADSSRLVSVGGAWDGQGEVQLWDVSTGKEVRTFRGHRGLVNCVAFSPDGRMIATGGYDRTLRLWEVASGAERRHIVGHEDTVHSVAFSPDGRFLAAASNDAPVYIWDVYRRE